MVSSQVKEASAQYSVSRYSREGGNPIELGVPPGYKQTEVGVIPDDWIASTIGENTHWSSGGTPNRKRADYWQGIIPWISGSTLKTLEISTSDQFLTSEGVTAGSNIAPVDATLLLVRGSALHKHIRVGLVVSPVSFNQDVKSLTPFKSVFPKYLTFYIKGMENDLLKLVSSAGNSAGVLDTELVKNFKFFKPSIEEQTVIANALSDVDALITSLEKLIAKKRAIKTAAMQQLFTGKKRLPPFDKTHTGYKQTELGEMPEDWEISSIGNIFKITAGGDLRKSEYSDDQTQEHSFPIYSNALTDEGLYGFCLTHDYDGNFITITARGGIGHAEERNGRFCAIGRLLVLEPIKGMNCKFITEYINQYLTFANESTGVPQLTAPQVSHYEVVTPLQKEQELIAVFLSSMDDEIDALQKRLTKTQQLKQGMMQELLTGRTRLL